MPQSAQARRSRRRRTDTFAADSASQSPTIASDELTAQWPDLARQLLEELGMAPAAARLAAAQELGLAG